MGNKNNLKTSLSIGIFQKRNVKRLETIQSICDNFVKTIHLRWLKELC